jgi:uncharacterized protein YndB with AHSA1/START domain
MGRSQVRKTITVRAPMEHVFECITNHEDMSNWAGARVRLIREGEPRNGVGAVRQMNMGGLKLNEKVVRFDPPSSYEYTIVKGLPVDHRGSVILTQEGDDVRLDWTIEMNSRIPLFAQAVGFALDRGLTGALRKFARRTEESAPKA